MSKNDLHIAKESAMVPYPDADGIEIPTLVDKGRTVAAEGSRMYRMFPELFEPLKAHYDAEDEDADDKPVRTAAKRAAKKAAERVRRDSPMTAPVSASKLKKGDVPTPPAGGTPNQDPAGEGGPDKDAGGTEIPPLHEDDPKAG